MEISKPSSYVVFSGGSACNHILDGFHKTGANDVSYILGISDNGGSTVRNYFFFLIQKMIQINKIQ
jgi:hypothetical protein